MKPPWYPERSSHEGPVEASVLWGLVLNAACTGNHLEFCLKAELHDQQERRSKGQAPYIRLEGLLHGLLSLSLSPSAMFLAWACVYVFSPSAIPGQRQLSLCFAPFMLFPVWVLMCSGTECSTATQIRARRRCRGFLVRTHETEAIAIAIENKHGVTFIALEWCGFPRFWESRTLWECTCSLFLQNCNHLLKLKLQMKTCSCSLENMSRCSLHLR